MALSYPDVESKRLFLTESGDEENTAYVQSKQQVCVSNSGVFLPNLHGEEESAYYYLFTIRQRYICQETTMQVVVWLSKTASLFSSGSHAFQGAPQWVR